MILRTALAAVLVLLTAMAAAADPAVPARTTLASIPLDAEKLVARLDATRVDFAPGQVMPEHRHTVPVVCIVTRGAFVTSIGDSPLANAGPGAVTYEPPGVIVHFFRNASTTEPAQLTCVLAAGKDDVQTSIMLAK